MHQLHNSLDEMTEVELRLISTGNFKIILLVVHSSQPFPTEIMAGLHLAVNYCLSHRWVIQKTAYRRVGAHTPRALLIACARDGRPVGTT